LTGGTAITRDYVSYGYDYAGNRSWRRDVGAGFGSNHHDQLYDYDELHRLKNFKRGSLTGTAPNYTGVSSRNREQDWSLDQLGNWKEFDARDTDVGSWDLEQSRTHNDANELTAVGLQSGGAGSAWVDPTLDNAGNIKVIPSPLAPLSSFSLKYDAWNRMVEVRENDSAVQINEYDGLNRRIVRERVGAETRHFYYNQQWQVVEQRVGSSTSADVQYLYHPNYVDAVAMRYDANGDRHLYLQDANFNVTTITDDAGAVEERYSYTPYGEVTILNANFSEDDPGNCGTSDIDNEYLYTGRKRDPGTWLQLNRNRFYSSHLGRWVNRDPIGYRGGFNLYRYVGGRPTYYLDPSGLQPHPGLVGGGNYGPVQPPSPPAVTAKYCRASRENPQNGWLKCACEVSGDIGRGMEVITLCSIWSQDCADKLDWFHCTRNCLSERWEDAMDNQENGTPLNEGSAWDDWCDECEANEGSQSCCEKQVEGEQGELEDCMQKCGKWKWGNTLPINLIPNWPEDADFNDLDDRVDFGKKRCCPAE